MFRGWLWLVEKGVADWVVLHLVSPGAPLCVQSVCNLRKLKTVQQALIALHGPALCLWWQLNGVCQVCQYDWFRDFSLFFNEKIFLLYSLMFFNFLCARIPLLFFSFVVFAVSPLPFQTWVFFKKNKPCCLATSRAGAFPFFFPFKWGLEVD